jgi:four helix bundle protein
MTSEDVRMGASYKDMIVWQRAVELSVAIYRLTSAFPSSEQFGLTSQLRRAGVSVASNIAEGYGKASKGEYVQFLGHARGSNFEVQTQLTIAGEMKFGPDKFRSTANDLSEEVSRMLVSLMSKLL